jgi:hypothetical protein
MTIALEIDAALVKDAGQRQCQQAAAVMCRHHDPHGW